MILRLQLNDNEEMTNTVVSILENNDAILLPELFAAEINSGYSKKNNAKSGIAFNMAMPLFFYLLLYLRMCHY